MKNVISVDRLKNLFEAVYNAGRISAGEVVNDTVHKGAYIAIVPKEALKDLHSLLISKLPDTPENKAVLDEMFGVES